MNKTRWFAVLLLFGLMAPVQAERHALLVGVGDYQHPGMNDLEGPPEDVAALKRVLMERWGVAEGNIRTLVDRDATKQKILDEIRGLAKRLSSGDQALIYFSGHGTSSGDSGMWEAASPIAPGTGAFMPYDAVPKGARAEVLASLLMTNQDLLPVLDEIDRSGAETLVVADSCYSGHTVRSMGTGLASRQQKAFYTDGADAAMDASISDSVAKIPPYHYKNITYLSAATEGEQAIDIRNQDLRQRPTLDGRPHGAFTDGLLRILSGRATADANGDERVSHLELRDAAKGLLAGMGLSHTPQLHPSDKEDQNSLRQRSLFAARSIVATANGDKPIPFRVALGEGLGELESALRDKSWAQRVQGRGDVQVVARDGDWLLLSSADDVIGRTPAANVPMALHRLSQMQWVHEVGARQIRANALGLELAVEPERKGGNFQFGDFLNIRVKVAKPVWLVLLNIAASGDVEPLYPFKKSELNPLSPGQNLFLPDPDPAKSICVSGPEGTDHLIALAFSERPPMLEQLLGQRKLGFDHPAIEQWRALIQKDAIGQSVSAAVTPIRILKGDGKCSH
ncbi:MAG: caspase family protein [Gammaproteobacteria bacterium]|nr:caspase family protein [Gammaproteobacteria bacterium]MBU1655487.1 caspase family protein [Gammaproteobacteria bacterium]MBU1962265.1 caspase family protein [Gammaproteobacteria bacterium]